VFLDLVEDFLVGVNGAVEEVSGGDGELSVI
jgi:hypothetical protein